MRSRLIEKTTTIIKFIGFHKITYLLPRANLITTIKILKENKARTKPDKFTPINSKLSKPPRFTVVAVCKVIVLPLESVILVPAGKR